MGLGDLNPVRIIEGKGAVGESAIGKLAPLALGAYLGPGAFGIEGLGMAAADAGLVAGAGIGALTGSLEKGLMAGLGAYGGAGLGEAASKGVTSATLDRQEAILNAIKNEQAVVPNALTSGESFKAAMGKEGIGSLGAKDLAQYGLAAAAPSLLEQKKLSADKADLTKNAYIRPKTYDPVTHRYYDLPAVKAADWGARSFADYRDSLIAPAREYADGGVTDDGMAGGGPMMGTNSAFDFQQRSEPVVRMADGGVAHFDGGGYTYFSPQEINDYISKNNLDAAGIAAATAQFHADPAAVAAAQAQQAGIQQAYQNAYTGAGAPDVAAYVNANSADAITSALNAPNMQNVYGTSQGGQKFSNAADLYQITHGGSFAPIDASIDKWLTDNADLVSANPTIARRFGEQAMLDSGINQFDVLKATGKTLDEIFKEKTVAKPLPLVKGATPGGVSTTGGGRTTDTYTGGTATTPATYRPAGASNPYGNYINPGDITINPDGSRTVSTNQPHKPYAGWTSIGQVKDAYTAGGGSLGQVLTPSREYTTSGGTKAAYDYLMGKGSWADTPTQPAMAKRNTYIDFSNPSEAEKKQFAKYAKVWRDGVMVDNPYYANPVTTKANGGLMAAYSSGGFTQPLASTLSGDVQNAYDKLDSQGMANSKRGKQLKQELDYRAKMKSYQQTPEMPQYAMGGPTHLGDYSDGGRLLRGPGDGVSDSIPATIGGKQPARLADGEFVVPARIVSELGNGSTEAGARKLYEMMDRVQKARGKTVGKGKVAKNTRADKYLPG